MVQKRSDNKPTLPRCGSGTTTFSPQPDGFPSTATTVPVFVANYSTMINQLVAGAPRPQGVLIAVVQVAGVPLLFQAGVLADRRRRVPPARWRVVPCR